MRECQCAHDTKTSETDLAALEILTLYFRTLESFSARNLLFGLFSLCVGTNMTYILLMLVFVEVEILLHLF